MYVCVLGVYGNEMLRLCITPTHRPYSASCHFAAENSMDVPQVGEEEEEEEEVEVDVETAEVEGGWVPTDSC